MQIIPVIGDYDETDADRFLVQLYISLCSKRRLNIGNKNYDEKRWRSKQ